MYKLLFALLLLSGIPMMAQENVQWSDSVRVGINADPTQTQIGAPPYEMDGRKEVREPILTFDDCTKWNIRSYNAEVKLFRSKEQRIISEYSGKVTYKTTKTNAGFRLELKEPIQFKKEWNCINFWNFGSHWHWEKGYEALIHHVVIKDAKNREIVIPFTQEWLWRNMEYKYWFLNHIKLNDSIARPIQLLGLEFTGDHSVPNQINKIYLGPLYGYKEELKPMTFQKFPEKLPFPLRKETILPINKEKQFTNEIKKSGSQYIFKYKAKDGNITYKVNYQKPLDDIIVEYKKRQKCINKGADIIFANHQQVDWSIVNETIKEDTLWVDYLAKNADFSRLFKCSYTIRQKSLIWTIEEKAEEGCVEKMTLGTTSPITEGKIVEAPYLVYDHICLEDDKPRYCDAPGILYDDDLFYLTMFDWYYTNASRFYAGEKGIKDDQVLYNGGVKYKPLNNGKINPLRERLFINVSPDVQEVFPTIDNPKSSMKTNQADRFWVANQGTDLEQLGSFVSDMRFHGVEKVSIRYHEQFWRQDGESYTFRLEPNPDLGVDRLKNFVSFIKSQDWRVGFYTNYMDISPVNALWSEDLVRISDKDGGWGPAWCRCYAPKVSKGWEIQQQLAPQIHKMFGTNFSYCDVETCISPMNRVDYDYRVPGAGKFRAVINYIGMTLLNEKRAYQGPVYSEGGNQFFYSGLSDGNQAHVELNGIVFPDFHLLKMHPLEMDGLSLGDSQSYIAYAYTYGDLGMLTNGFEGIRRYAFLQPFQSSYVMTPISNIEYFDGKNYLSTSEAIKKDLLKSPGVRITYKSGLITYANFSSKIWNVVIDGNEFALPKYGVLATLPGSNLFSVSSLNKESKTQKLLEKVYSNDLYYLNTYGETVKGELGGQGSYMLKKEKFGWEIIPLQNLENVDFNLSLLGLSEYGVDVEAVDKRGDVMKVINTDPFVGKVAFSHQMKYAKYRICPVVTVFVSDKVGF